MNTELASAPVAKAADLSFLDRIPKRGPAAAEILKKVNVRRYRADADLIRGCLKSPTYLPGGKQLLWNEAA